VLVLVAALYAGEARRQAAIDTGMDLSHLAIAQIDFGMQRYQPARAREISGSIVTRLAADRAVRSTAVMSGLPAGLGSTPGASLRSVDGAGAAAVSFVAGSPAMFDTLGVAIVRGRPFGARDSAQSAPVVILSEAAAAQVFGTTDPLGREVVFERRRAVGEAAQPPVSMAVVGVARDTDSSVAGRRDIGVAYLPLEQHYEPGLVLAARTFADPTPVVARLRAAIQTADSALAIVQAGSGAALAGPDTAFPRAVAGIAGFLGMTALILALAGLYGVLSYVFAARTREIGIRLALGAGEAAIRRMVLKDGLRPVLLGLMGGICASLLVRAVLRPFVLRIVPRADLALMTLVPLLFIAAGVAACYLPAMRASRVQPNVALRDS
jgi:putative ABC transport system permease protein